MPRKIKPSDIYKQRQKNYLFHFDEYKQFASLPIEDQERFTKISLLLGMPRLTITGSYVDGVWARVAKMASLNKIPEPLWGMVAPYVTVEGWKMYQEMFQQLPDPVEIPQGINVSDWLLAAAK